MIEEEPITMKVFYSYAREDQALRDELEKHLGNLRWQGIITSWSNRNISAGEEWEQKIHTYLDEADIILLLISSDFIHSKYCYSVELQKALEKQRAKQAEVLPILLRPVDWEESPFSHLSILPANAKPINTWPNLDEAFVEVVKGIKQVVQDRVVQKYLQRGQEWLSEAQPEQALIACEKAIQIDRTSHEAFASKGAILLDYLHLYEEAIAAYQRASDLDPANIFYLVKVGDLLSNDVYTITLSPDDRKKAALAAYQKASELEPTNASYLIKVGDLLPSRRALVAYRRASELEPTNASYFMKIGDTISKYSKKEIYEEGLAAYRQASELEPTNASYLIKMGEFLRYELERPEEALTAYRMASELEPTNASYLIKMGELLRDDLKRPEEALVAYRRASELDPTSSKHYVSMIEILAELHRYEEAISVCEQARELEPKSGWFQRKIGDLLATLHRYEEAIVAYQVAYQEPEARKALLQEKMGDIYLNHLENRSTAIAAYRQASEDDPTQARYQAKIGDILSERYEEKYEEAFAAYRQASECDASEPSYYEKQAETLEQWARKLRNKAINRRKRLG